VARHAWILGLDREPDAPGQCDHPGFRSRFTRRSLCRLCPANDARRGDGPSVAGTGTPGTAAPETSVAIAGTSGTGSVGTVTASTDTIVGITGVIVERLFLQWLYKLDHLYGLLLTFGVTLMIEGVFRSIYGSSGLSYSVPEALQGATDLDFMILPNYRAWVVVASLVVCFATWFVIEKTKLGAYLRAGTENPRLVEAFGINVPLMVTLTYGFGVALAAFAGVLAAPIYQVAPLMGSNLIIVVFAVVVIGGMGSIMGSILTGLGLGVIEGFTKVFYPEASSTVVFIIMAVVLWVRPAGLFGKEK
jgi:branched-chain amino acid transport system permease protein